MNASPSINTNAPRKSLLDALRRPLRQLHWISAALCVFSLCFYAVTGFFLNNEDLIKTEPKTAHVEKPLPDPLAASLSKLDNDQALSPQDAQTIGEMFGVDMRYAKARVMKGKVTITTPEPGVRSSFEVNTKAMTLVYERTDRGVLAFFNDLHKGKNVRPLWHWFINLFAVSVLVFAVSGLALLFYQARHRKPTWPLIGGGVILPVLFFILLMHL